MNINYKIVFINNFKVSSTLLYKIRIKMYTTFKTDTIDKSVLLSINLSFSLKVNLKN